MKQAWKRLTANISPRERNILILAALVVLVFIATSALPAIGEVYRQRQANIESLRLDVAREQRLIEDTQRWRERRAEVEGGRTELEERIFSGATIPLVEAAIQRDLTRHARDGGIDVLSTRLAQRRQTGDWIMISQEMSFRTGDAANSIRFLEALENSTPRLFVKDFSLDRSRANYSGAITVVGFARGDGLTTQAQAALR